MRRLLIALCLLLVAAPAAEAKKKPRHFQVGAATTSTDPVDGERLCLGGYGSCPRGGGRTMTGVRDPMKARAIAISHRNKGFVLVHTTNIGYFAAYKTPGLGIYHLRQAVARRTGIPASSVLVQADHSHSAPDTIGIWGGVPPKWLKHMQDRAVDAAVQAWETRRPARVFAGTADGTGVTSSYEEDPNRETDDVFNLLWADDATTRERIVTWTNYSPHATVLKSDNKRASGDWPEWASQIAERDFGGVGVAGVGTLGREDFGTDGNEAERVAQALTRLERMMAEATANGEEVTRAGGVAARSVFIREPLAQPILLANLFPEGSIDAGGYDLSIDRSYERPWLEGGMIGTYAGAARVGDVFIGTAPGEAFPQLQFYLRDQKGITGARMHMFLGATNDFLGYMVRPVEDYPQVFRKGVGYLAGCPYNVVLEATGIDKDGACPDHWTLMVSPTMGSHAVCTIQNAGLHLGFSARTRDPNCEAITSTDGVGAPVEAPQRRR